jgi:hypothetical protein
VEIGCLKNTANGLASYLIKPHRDQWVTRQNILNVLLIEAQTSTLEMKRTDCEKTWCIQVTTLAGLVSTLMPNLLGQQPVKLRSPERLWRKTSLVSRHGFPDARRFNIEGMCLTEAPKIRSSLSTIFRGLDSINMLSKEMTGTGFDSSRFLVRRE